MQIFAYFECSLCVQKFERGRQQFEATLETSKRSDLPHPNGSLLASVKEANEAVKSVTSLRERASGEEVMLNSNLSSKLQPAGMHDNQAAIRHFSKQLGVIFRLHEEY